MGRVTVQDYLIDAVVGLRVLANLHQFSPECPDSENRCTCFQCSRAWNALTCVTRAIAALAAGETAEGS